MILKLDDDCDPCEDKNASTFPYASCVVSNYFAVRHSIYSAKSEGSPESIGVVVIIVTHCELDR